jgi:hypothetical protein
VTHRLLGVSSCTDVPRSHLLTAPLLPTVGRQLLKAAPCTVGQLDRSRGDDRIGAHADHQLRPDAGCPVEHVVT